MTAILQARHDRKVKALAQLSAAFSDLDLTFAETQEAEDVIIRCTPENSMLEVIIGISSMWVRLGNIEIRCRKISDLVSVFRSLLDFEQAVELQPHDTLAEAVTATFARYAAQINAEPGFEKVAVQASDDDYQRHFVLEAYAPGVADPFLRIELEFCNPNPQQVTSPPEKEYAAYFWLQGARYKLSSFSKVIRALRTGELYEPSARLHRMQPVEPSSLYSECGRECAVRARDVMYCLPELLRRGYTDFTLQAVETRVTAVLPRMRSLSPIAALINDPGTMDVYVGRIPKVI